MNKRAKLLTLFSIMSSFVLVTVYNGCGSGFENATSESLSVNPGSTGSQGSITFLDFSAIITKNCVACHGGTNSPFSTIVDFSKLASEKDWIDAGLVVSGDPANSSVYYRLVLGDGKGPKNMPFAFTGIPNNMTAAEAQQIKEYIANIPNTQMGGGTSTPTPTPSPAAITKLQCTPETRGTAQDRINRLSKFELVNSLVAVFGSNIVNTTGVQSALAIIDEDGTESLGRALKSDNENALGFVTLGEAVATALLANATALNAALPGCNVANALNTCKTQLVGNFGTKIYRRPLTDLQKFSILNLVDQVGGADGLKLGIATMLASPFFTKHIELGDINSADCTKPVSNLLAGANGTFWAPNGGAIVQNYNQDIAVAGWYVFGHAAAAITQPVNEVRVSLLVQGAATLAININDQAFKATMNLAAGANELVFDAGPYPQNAAIKLGLYVTPTAGSSVKMVSSSFNSKNDVNCVLAGNRVKVSQYELASRISYRAAGVPPDALLLSAAQNNQLNSLAMIDAHVERLLNSTAGHNKVINLFTTWLKMQGAKAPAQIYQEASGINGLNLSKGTYEDFTKYIEYIVFNKKGSFKDLHTDNTIFAHTPELAKYYGVAQSTQPQKDGTGTYAGLILRPAVTISSYDHTSPIARGNFVRRRLLCDHLPDPDPQAVQDQLAKVDDDPLKSSTRTIVMKKTEPALCMGCHGLMNPIGYTLEHIDSFGKYRPLQKVFDQNGNVVAEHAIDTAVANVSLDMGKVTPVNDAAGLLTAISNSPKAMTCMNSSLIEFNRNIVVSAKDNCLMNEVNTLIESNGSIYDILVNSISSEDIFYKAAGE